MKSASFIAKIENGKIRLPKHLDDFNGLEVHVAVKIETPEDLQVRKARLIAAFKKAQEADIFRNIEDPSALQQRSLRDEWE